jgi:hypothetical protein
MVWLLARKRGSLVSLSDEYGELFLSFARERNLGLDDTLWPEKDYNDFGALQEALVQRRNKAIEEAREAKADEEYEEDFYLIDVSVTSADGPSYETIDVRTLSLEQLSKICNTFPQFNQYYFKKVRESL